MCRYKPSRTQAILQSLNLWYILTITTDYCPISCHYHDHLLAMATQRRFVKVQYFTELHELISTNALLKDFITTPHKEEFVVLSSGEQIRLDRLVAVDGIIAPQYVGHIDLSCGC